MRISMVRIPTTVIRPVHGCTQIVKDVVEVFHGVLIWNWMTRDELRVVVLRLLHHSMQVFELSSCHTPSWVLYLKPTNLGSRNLCGIDASTIKYSG
jgi:hypothetical protein